MCPDIADHRQALENLSVIRHTIDRATGASYVNDFLRGAGILFLLFGVLTMAAAVFTHYVNTGVLRLSYPFPAVVLAWGAVVGITGAVKGLLMVRRAKATQLSLGAYVKRMMGYGTLHALIPTAIGALALLGFLWRSREIATIPAVITIYAGATYAVFGTSCMSQRAVILSYEMALLGSAGLLFLADRVTLYMGVMGAVFAINGVVEIVLSSRSTLSARSDVSKTTES